jgi:gag-polypeptide of LTR copia-type
MIAGSRNAKEVWTRLTAAHKVEHNSMTAFYTTIALLKQEYKDGKSMQQHISSYLTDNHLLYQIGPKHMLSNEFLAQLLLMSLPHPSNWEIIVISFINAATNSSPLTFQNVSTQLLQEASH